MKSPTVKTEVVAARLAVILQYRLIAIQWNNRKLL